MGYRWFSKDWQELGKEFSEQPREKKEYEGYRPKPIERRTLHDTTRTTASQGKHTTLTLILLVAHLFLPCLHCVSGTLDLWVDMLTPAEVRSYKPFDIRLPPPEEYELRVVIWNTEGVKACDEFTNMNDLFCRVWVNEETPQESDIHWRAKRGKGSYSPL